MFWMQVHMPCLRRRVKVVHGGSRRSCFSLGALLDVIFFRLASARGLGLGSCCKFSFSAEFQSWQLGTELLVKRCFHACRFLMFSVYRTARGRSELTPCIVLKNPLTRFKTFLVIKNIFWSRKKLFGDIKYFGALEKTFLGIENKP